MRVIDEFPQREIDRFGSEGFTHSRLARGEIHVSIATIAGVIGGHPAASRQLLVVLRGTVTARTETESAELAERQAVLWEPGEWHETRGDALVLLVEGEFEPFA
jgi:redox-sensitive bicupin YhaK (pirin superfamily)